MIYLKKRTFLSLSDAWTGKLRQCGGCFVARLFNFLVSILSHLLVLSELLELALMFVCRLIFIAVWQPFFLCGKFNPGTAIYL